MNAVLEFEIEFYGPFRVATGLAAREADISVDLQNQLPATSLKGLMRDAAHIHLGLDEAIIDEVFGSTKAASPWSWTQGALVSSKRSRTRVRIDPERGIVERGALIVSEELWVAGKERGHFQIIQRLRIDEADRRDSHAAILQASAAAVHSIGSDRKRGFGWVSIAPTEVNWDNVLDQISQLEGSGP